MFATLYFVEKYRHTVALAAGLAMPSAQRVKLHGVKVTDGLSEATSTDLDFDPLGNTFERAALARGGGEYPPVPVSEHGSEHTYVTAVSSLCIKTLFSCQCI